MLLASPIAKFEPRRGAVDYHLPCVLLKPHPDGERPRSRHHVSMGDVARRAESVQPDAVLRLRITQPDPALLRDGGGTENEPFEGLTGLLGDVHHVPTIRRQSC